MKSRIGALMSAVNDLDEAIELHHLTCQSVHSLETWNRVNQLALPITRDPAQTIETLTKLAEKLRTIKMPYWLEHGDPSWAVTKAYYDTRARLVALRRQDQTTSLEQLMEDLDIVLRDDSGLYENGKYRWSPAPLAPIRLQVDRILDAYQQEEHSVSESFEFLTMLQVKVGHKLASEEEAKKPGGWHENNLLALMANELVRKNPRQFANHPDEKVRRLAATSA